MAKIIKFNVTTRFQIWMKSDVENLQMPASVLMYDEDYLEIFN